MHALDPLLYDLAGVKCNYKIPVLAPAHIKLSQIQDTNTRNALFLLFLFVILFLLLGCHFVDRPGSVIVYR